jgi:hypothetical protein
MLVGLTGPSGAKKTLAAKHLERRHGFVRLHAGEPVKAGVRDGFGLTKKETKGKGKDRPSGKLGGASPRAVMEAYGAGLHAVAPTATAMHLHRRVAKLLAAGKSVVVDGVRGEHEAAAIKKMGGQIWRLDNGKKPNDSLPMDQRQKAVKADATIDSSSGDKELIRANVDRQVAKLFGMA